MSDARIRIEIRPDVRLAVESMQRATDAMREFAAVASKQLRRMHDLFPPAFWAEVRKDERKRERALERSRRNQAAGPRRRRHGRR